MIRPGRLCCAMLLVAAAARAGADDLRLDYVRESLTGTVRHYTQFIDGLPVVGGERIERTQAGSAPRVVFERLARRGEGAFTAAAMMAVARGERVYVNVAGEARLAVRVVDESRRLEPHARYFDAVTGMLLRDDPLFYSVRGRVFDVNPVAKLNDPSLRDHNDAASAVPDAAYTIVDLPEIDVPSPLSGPDASIVDVEAPFTPHADATTPLDSLDRSRPEFEEVNAFFQVGRSKGYLRSLGYFGPRELVAYSIPIDAHAANGTDNSYYIETTAPGTGRLSFGDGGTDDAEDSDILLHEFGHAIHDWIAPGALSGQVSSQARAISEGFADYWSFSSTYAATSASGRDPFCIADWDVRCGGDDPSQSCGAAEGTDCLRRVDSAKTMADYVVSDAAGTEYLNSSIWSSALREIFMTLVARDGADEGKRISDTIVLESLFGVPPSPSFHDVAQRMVEADRALRGGADDDAVCAAMAARGIFAAGECVAAPRGEWTLFQSPGSRIAIPDAGAAVESSVTVGDARAIDAVAVRVDIAHPVRGDLTISLRAPDGTTVVLKQSSQVDRTPDVHATFGLDAAPAASLDLFRGRSAAGVWTLIVRDVYAGDTGTLISWSLDLKLAGDVPQTTRPEVANARFAAAAHATGAAERTWTTDVRLLNRGTRAATATIVFTPAGSDGRTDFAAMHVAMPPGEVVRLDDVVEQLEMRGAGSLEIGADSADVIATTRTFVTTPEGTFGDVLMPADGATHVASAWLARAPGDPRSNIGIVETSGASGTIRIRLYDANPAWGGLIDEREVTISPFGFIQIPGDFPEGASIDTSLGMSVVADLEVVSGGAQIVAYASLIDETSGDPVNVAATPVPTAARSAFLPLVASSGVGATWKSRVWLASTAPSSGIVHRQAFDGVSRLRADDSIPVPRPETAVEITAAPIPIAFGALRFDLPAGTDIVSEIRNGANGEFVPLFTGYAGRDVVGVEVSADFRANGGVLNPNDVAAHATLRACDAAGAVLGRFETDLPPLGIAQFPLPAGTARLSIDGGVFGYASVVDNRSGDAVFLPAQ